MCHNNQGPSSSNQQCEYTCALYPQHQRGMESSNSGSKNGNFFVEWRKVRDAMYTRAGMVLFIYKFLNYLCEVGLIDLIWIDTFHYM